MPDDDTVLEAARRLRWSPRRRPVANDESVTFAHLPLRVAPPEAIDRLRRSPVSALVPPEGAIVNAPGRWDTFRVLPVRAGVDRVIDAYVTVTLRTPPAWSFTDGSIEVRLLFEDEGEKAHVSIGASSASGRSRRFERSTYDHQFAETGYEGERPSFVEASDRDVRRFLSLVDVLVAR